MSEHDFITQDKFMAAYLAANRLKVADVMWTGNKAVFAFNKTQALEHLVGDFHNEHGTNVNALRLRRCLSEINRIIYGRTATGV